MAIRVHRWLSEKGELEMSLSDVANRNVSRFSNTPAYRQQQTALEAVLKIKGMMCGALSLWCVVLAMGAAFPVSAADIDYNRDVRPILADKCFVCHGPDQGKREADLQLDTSAGAYAPLASDSSKVAILPGKPEQSEAYLRMTTSDRDLKMPPAVSNLPLTPAQQETIRKWIEQGAEYQSHWAFLAPQKGAVPMLPGQDWVRGEIDAFVLQAMQNHQLSPNPPAMREHLLRRVTFDLTGFPPTLEELDAFLEDHSPDAYGKVVDRLLASERFGERMASEWLDVARYSDTYGFQVDAGRFVWPWRDWVIRAFNANMPYDQFIVEQLAGDLLPNPTQDQILATTFCRLHPQESEGGSVPEEYRTGYVADRLQTFSTAFLGMTFECCKCHDHKYDPFTQREYFELASFFDNIDEAGLYSYFTPSIPTPTLLLTDESARQKIAEQQELIREREQELQRQFGKSRDGFLKWKAEQTSAPAELPGQVLHLDFEKVQAPNRASPGVIGQAVELTGDDPVKTEVGNFHRYEPFSISLWMNAPVARERAVILHRSQAWTDAGSRGYELLMLDGDLSFALIHFDPGNSVRVQTVEPFPLNSWHHISVTYDGSSRADGVKLYLDGKLVQVEVIRDKLTKEITGGGGDHITIGERMRDHGFTNGKVDELRVYSRELTPLEVGHLHDGNSLPQALAARTEAQDAEDVLWPYYLNTVDAEFADCLAALQSARQQAAEFIETIPEIMVMEEMPEPRQTFVLVRGEYNLRGDPVESATPRIFPPMPEDAPRNRLGLAQWLTHPDHPLAARVAVNRYWQLLFGTGLVRTTEDLGNQGEWPTHPELLDWLARDFIEHGWNVKRLMKQMVMSATYQQSALVSPEKEALDPSNRWLSRAYSERFTAEMLRDNALVVSGLMVDRVGGAPVKPYEVEVAFKPLPRDQGEGLYRRSLYTYWSRTGPAPAMMTLDAAKRDVCQVRRERTLSPLQPLVLLNGPQFVEAARVLAERVLRAHPADVDTMLVDLFRWTTSRRPSDAELSVIRKLYEQHLADFEAHPEQATAFLSVGEKPRDETLNGNQLAAVAGVANLLLNYDECVFRR